MSDPSTMGSASKFSLPESSSSPLLFASISRSLSPVLRAKENWRPVQPRRSSTSKLRVYHQNVSIEYRPRIWADQQEGGVASHVGEGRSAFIVSSKAGSQQTSGLVSYVQLGIGERACTQSLSVAHRRSAFVGALPTRAYDTATSGHAGMLCNGT